MTHTTPDHRGKRAAALVAGSLVAVIFATGLCAIALGSGKRARPRPPALTGRIRLNHRDVRSGGSVRGEVVFESHASKTVMLMRGCKIDGVYAIALRASDGYLQQPAFSLVGCHPEQMMVAEPGTTIYRFNLRANYTRCSQSAKDQPPRSSKYWTPLCLKDTRGQRDVMPPLPAGKHSALFFPGGEWHGPHVKPAELDITGQN
jgi:hypothetical protein